MEWDIKSWNIVLGVLVGFAFGGIEIYRRGKLDSQSIINTVIVFLAVQGCALGVNLISASIKGEIAKIPHFWREYLAIAGIIGFGMSFNLIIQTFKKAVTIKKPTKDDQP